MVNLFKIIEMNVKLEFNLKFIWDDEGEMDFHGEWIYRNIYLLLSSLIALILYQKRIVLLISFFKYYELIVITTSIHVM